MNTNCVKKSPSFNDKVNVKVFHKNSPPQELILEERTAKLAEMGTYHSKEIKQ